MSSRRWCQQPVARPAVRPSASARSGGRFFLNMKSHGKTTWINHQDWPLQFVCVCRVCLCTCAYLPPTCKGPPTRPSSPRLHSILGLGPAFHYLPPRRRPGILHNGLTSNVCPTLPPAVWRSVKWWAGYASRTVSNVLKWPLTTTATC